MSATMLDPAERLSQPLGPVRSPRMIRVAELASRLDLPEKRVYILARQGVIPHVRLGRSIRFNEAEIEALIAAGGAGYPEEQ